jgi:hypothetical protein
MKHFLFFLPFFLVLNLAFAVDMVSPSEQFYVAQGLFNELKIEAATCDVQDDLVNFACGQFNGDAATFQAQANTYITQNLPGLYLALDWFQNGQGIARDYRSAKGRYLFGYNPGGYVVIAFIPK